MQIRRSRSVPHSARFQLVGVESPAQGAAPASALLPGVVVAGLVVAPLVSVLVESVAGLVVVVSVL